ncbi:MAG: hypothetical protein WC284_18710 [Candidimonas sp.]
MIWLIIGLPGSGKTHLGKTLSEQLGCPFIDDIVDINGLPDHDPFIVSDIACCDGNVARLAIEYMEARFGCEVEVIYFVNDPEQCLRNVERRNDGRLVTEAIKNYSKIYKPINPIPVWKPDE